MAIGYNNIFCEIAVVRATPDLDTDGLGPIQKAVLNQNPVAVCDVDSRKSRAKARVVTRKLQIADYYVSFTVIVVVGYPCLRGDDRPGRTGRFFQNRTPAVSFTATPMSEVVSGSIVV